MAKPAKKKADKAFLKDFFNVFNYIDEEAEEEQRVNDLMDNFTTVFSDKVVIYRPTDNESIEDIAETVVAMMDYMGAAACIEFPEFDMDLERRMTAKEIIEIYHHCLEAFGIKEDRGNKKPAADKKADEKQDKKADKPKAEKKAPPKSKGPKGPKG